VEAGDLLQLYNRYLCWRDEAVAALLDDEPYGDNHNQGRELFDLSKKVIAWRKSPDAVPLAMREF
jgi:hypothetical protein